MATDFSKFDKAIDKDDMKKKMAEARQNNGNTDTPDGTYTVKLEKMELGETGANSAGGAGRPMLKAQFRITEGEHKKKCIFFNRVIFGTKNDANMIANAESFLKSLEPSEDVGAIIFESYSQFADLIMDIMEDIDGVLEYEIEYKKTAFNPVKIIEVYEI